MTKEMQIYFECAYDLLAEISEHVEQKPGSEEIPDGENGASLSELCRRLRSHINTIKACCSTEWISITDRLPPPYKKVLVAYRRGITIAELRSCGGDPNSIKLEWCGWRGAVYRYTSITHWCPLPDPPEPGKGGQIVSYEVRLITQNGGY